jgi:hypothetical protein
MPEHKQYLADRKRIICTPDANHGVCNPSHILKLNLFSFNKIGEFKKLVLECGSNIKTSEIL